MLDVTDLHHTAGVRPILRGLSLRLGAGESLAVCGPSGCGKTTLLMVLLGLVKPASGAVLVAGTDITRLKGRKLAAHRRAHLGVVFQFGELLPELSPVENVALPALLAGTPRRDAYRDAGRLLDDLGVPADGTSTALLSGGERQRTAVARALVTKPALVLADEPTGALDGVARDVVADLLFAQSAQRGCALLVVTHDTAVADRADARLRLDRGVLARTGA
ncbi:ABC transporter ATP-binding protein [Actinomadura flavalba]|uniref:ABC transporter ATP-binding protein n=1 Tax=Actinomadura flavalba TaxID=1120938 RepID=UPI001F0AB198|nr:ABC transporter ATP-binding protein [Actinomadura flavalba]